MSYPASFNGAGCHVRGSQAPDSQAAEYTVRHVPGGAINILDVSGLKERTLTLTFFFEAEADYHTMLSQIGSTGSLVYAEYPSGVSAFLASLARTDRALGTVNQTTATAVLILT